MARPRGTRVSFGAWNPDAPPIGLAERMMRRIPAAGQALPAGDFCDWPAVDAWAAEIAATLRAREPAL